MLISAFNIRYLSTTELAELKDTRYGPILRSWSFRKKKKKNKKVGQNSKTICLWAEELIAVSSITETEFYEDSFRVCVYLLTQL